MSEESDKKRSWTVYLSGAITGTSDYKERFEAAEHQLREAGYEEVINPAKISALLPKGMPWGAYMEVMLPLLPYCDAIYMLEGWGGEQGSEDETIGASVFECDVWVCKNADSRYCEEWVGYDHNSCEEWEER